MAIAAIEMQIAMNPLGLPGEVISIVCGKALMMSSMEADIIMRLTSIVVLAIDLKGSSCLQGAWSIFFQ